MIFVGGEFYSDDRWHTGERTNFDQPGAHCYFLNGGQACLRVIGDYLVDHGIRRVLLPAYLCPTIPRVFAQCGIRFDFYQVAEDFSVDLADLSRLLSAAANQAVYFINYFGFGQPAAAVAYMKELRLRGIIVVEDNAQAGFRGSSVGNFVFNSLRKLAPHDGAYLYAPEPMDHYIEAYRGRVNHRLPVIRQYRKGLAAYLFQGQGNAESLDRLFQQADDFYERDQAVSGDPGEQEAIEHLDWQGICQTRRENYVYLHQQIRTIPGLIPVFPSLPEATMPMGLPVFFADVSRDRVNEFLGAAQIGLTIHWEGMLENPLMPAQKRATEMSARILTLPVDQYTNRTQLDYLVRQLRSAIEQCQQENTER